MINAFRNIILDIKVIPFLICILIFFFFHFYNIPFHSDLSHHNFLTIHTSFELVSSFLAFAIFVLGLATWEFVRTPAIIKLSIFSLFTSILDIGHFMSYAGMSDFITANSTNKSIYFWIFARAAEVIGLLLISFGSFERLITNVKSLRLPLVLGASLVLFLIFGTVLFLEDALPTLFIPGEGTTFLKTLLEAIICTLAICAGLIFSIKSTRLKEDESEIFNSLAYGSFLLALTSACFLTYFEVDNRFNYLGHAFKVVAMVYIFRAVFIECILFPIAYNQQLAIKANLASDAKTKFLANVSHELRTPLGIISGYTELLLANKKFTDDEGKGWGETIVNNAKQLRFLIDDLLDITKANAEKLEITPKVFKLSPFLEAISKSFDLPAREKNIDFIVDITIDEKTRFSSDQKRLEQILNNLISNAIKFTHKGEVRLTAGLEQDELIINIKDSGIGIDPKKSDLLFKPFSQLHKESKQQLGGTGLGLAISKKLANLLQGDLELVASQVGEGAEFKLSVKSFETAASQPNEKTKKRQIKDLKDQNLSGRNVLIVDDSWENLNLLKVYLTPTQANLIMCDGGEQSLELIEKNVPDIILMDIQMPGLDGYETVKEIRSRGHDLPIIAVSAHAHRSERDKAFKVGFNDYIAKPIDITKLKEVILQNI
ncbi:MAG: hypothetical protein CME62_06580 [Halobacteriovoraceae bacterium]|nr:hypothetical protein [Halobacteriovoraceae bacterium]|tara:strand:+ start:34146 stop:36119 length:1974 start_codon:yes stop_codon:yes gene_type:complete